MDSILAHIDAVIVFGAHLQLLKLFQLPNFYACTESKSSGRAEGTPAKTRCWQEVMLNARMYCYNKEHS